MKKKASTKENIYIYKDGNNNKYLYTFQKTTSDNKIIELKCKERLHCKGRAKFNIEDNSITITQNCNIKYEELNYAQNKLITVEIFKTNLEIILISKLI